MVFPCEAGTQGSYGEVNSFGVIMGECFRGWRRKIGAVTLLMALAFMGGWSRSLYLDNWIHFPVGTHATASVVSANQFVGVEFEFTESSPSQWGFYECKVEDTLPLNSMEYEDRNPLGYARDLVWSSEWLGFGMGGNFDELPTYWLMKTMIPYWSVVLTLTLISALLLSTSGKSTSEKSPAADTNEGGAGS